MNKAVRLAAIKGLGLIDDEGSFNELTPVLSSADAEESAAAATALGELGMERASTFISHCLSTETDPATKEATSTAIGKLRKHMD